MPCPNCGSHDLWDDGGNGYWGCNACKAMHSPNVSNTVATSDRFNQDDPYGVLARPLDRPRYERHEDDDD